MATGVGFFSYSISEQDNQISVVTRVQQKHETMHAVTNAARRQIQNELGKTEGVHPQTGGRQDVGSGRDTATPIGHWHP